VRGLISLVIAGGILLGVFVLVVTNPGRLGGVLPPAAIAHLEGLGGGLARSGDGPADFLDDTSEGLQAAGAIAARPGNEPVFIKHVIGDYSTDVGSDVPAEITTIRPIMGCRLTPPLDGTVVGHVTAGDSGVPLAMSTYNDAIMAATVQRFVDRYRETGEAATVDTDGLAYEAYDVAVTETGAPVYLVLQTTGGNRMWNIHLAPDARIERVVLLGGDQAGIANLDPVVPVEVILNPGLETCGIVPAFPLNAGHALMQSGAGSDVQLAEVAARAQAYDQWFRDSFGVPAAASRAGYDAGTMSVIGPVPGEADLRAVYAPIQGAKIRMTQDRFFEIAGQVAQGEDFASRVRAIATSFAFGDLANLRQGVEF
jgi:hypothetical protein